MTNAKTLFDNFFNDPRIIDHRIADFSDETIQRLTHANTGTEYDVIIGEVTAANSTLKGSLAQLIIDIREQRGTTYSVDQIIDAFINEVAVQHGLVKTLYHSNQPFYLQFYPHGMKDYNEATKANVFYLMEAYSQAATTHAADFDPAFVTLFNNFPTSFTNARNAQSTEKGEVDTGRGAIDTNRQALNAALYRAVHFAAFYVIGDWENFHALFDFTRLFPQGHSAPHEKFHGDLLPNTTVVVIHDTFPEGTKIKVRNFGTTDLMIGTKNDDDPTGLVWKTLKPGKTKTYTKDTLFSHPDDTYLMVHNPDLNDHLPYQIERWVED